VRFETGLTLLLMQDERAAAGRLQQGAKKGHLEGTEEEETLHPEDHQRNYKDHQHHNTHASINDAT